MIKKFIILLLTLSCSLSLFSEITEEQKYMPVKHWTVFRLCFSPGGPVILDRKVNGLNLGIPAAYTDKKCNCVNGLDIGIAATTSKTNGMQLSLMNTSIGSSGFMMALINMQNKVGGLQLGLINQSAFSKLFQIGIFNSAQYQTEVFQIGLLNYIDDAFIPFLPLINFKF